MDEEDYSSLSRDQLIDRIKSLKAQLQGYHQQSLSFNPHHQDQNIQHPIDHADHGNSVNSPAPTTRTIGSKTKKKTKDKMRVKPIKELDFKNYSKRKIALMVSYDGSQHGGLAWQPEITRLTTVEGELFRALLISRLVEGSRLTEECHNSELNNIRSTDRGQVSDRLDEDYQDSERWRSSVDINQWGYSRAGRTDAGVSGSGQVVSLWVRSRLNSVQPPFGFRPKDHHQASLPEKVAIDQHLVDQVEPEDEFQNQIQSSQESSIDSRPTLSDGRDSYEKDSDELPYHTILNSILPSSIRILAWSPVEEGFDARFSCLGRHYKYFFSIYETDRRSVNGNKLNIEAMREAALKLIGEHDFRNFCKIDPSKQLENFHRRIDLAQINPINDVDGHIGAEDQSTIMNTEDRIESSSENDLKDRLKSHSSKYNRMYVFDLIGSAFLYNMVRHIVSILFLIGSGLESVDLIERLFYTNKGSTIMTKGEEDDMEGLNRKLQSLLPVDCKPEYEHSNPMPLLLYRCIYPQRSFTWHPTPFESNHSSHSTINQLFIRWSIDRIRTSLSKQHLDSYDRLVLEHHTNQHQQSSTNYLINSSSNIATPIVNNHQKILIPLGAAKVLLSSLPYKPILDRPRNPHFSVINKNWWNKVGAKKFAKRH